MALHHLELFPVNEKATFQIHVDTTDNAELAVSVTGPRSDLPVEVTGNVKNGFLAEFVPDEVGAYVIGVDYNNIPVGGTPFTGKAYDSSKVMVSAIPWGTIGKPVEFTVDASKSGILRDAIWFYLKLLTIICFPTLYLSNILPHKTIITLQIKILFRRRR